MVGFDEYDRKARLTPGLLAVLPIAVLIATLGWRKYSVVAVVGGLVIGSGATYLLAVLVRHMGRRIEVGLWNSWGGAPTTTALLTSTETDNSIERDSWRSAVEIVTGLTLLAAEEEQGELGRAQQTIRAAVAQLTHLGSDPAYPRIKDENISYGFERNYFGIRWIGRGVSFASVAALVAVLLVGRHGLDRSGVPSAAIIAGIVIDGLICLSWLVGPSKKRIRLAAERYSRQLFQAVVVESRRAKQGTAP